jgi:cytochrome bd ubiquinol oxidase subunit II
VLWLLILRGISLEFRSHVHSELWNSFWDVVFAGASALLAIFFGAALGNVVRGVPLDAEGIFFLSLWTNLRPGAAPGIIDWYTVLVGVAAFLVLTMHGALWIALKTEGALRDRCQAAARRMWFLVLPVLILLSAASFAVQPLLQRSFTERPWGAIFPLAALLALFAIPWYAKRRAELAAFLASCSLILGLLCSAAIGLYPNLLPSNDDPQHSLTIANVSAGAYGLRVGLFWFLPAFALALAYSAFVYRHFAGKVRAGAHGH